MTQVPNPNDKTISTLSNCDLKYSKKKKKKTDLKYSTDHGLTRVKRHAYATGGKRL